MSPQSYAINLHVDYADTDAGGVVYHANYLVFMERARNAWLRNCGVSVTHLLDEHKMVFVTKEILLNYQAPAKLDDLIAVTLEVKKLNRASMICVQQVTRNHDLLVEAEIKLATLDSENFKPIRMPEKLFNAIQSTT